MNSTPLLFKIIEGETWIVESPSFLRWAPEPSRVELFYASAQRQWRIVIDNEIGERAFPSRNAAAKFFHETFHRAMSGQGQGQ